MARHPWSLNLHRLVLGPAVGLALISAACGGGGSAPPAASASSAAPASAASVSAAPASSAAASPAASTAAVANCTKPVSFTFRLNWVVDTEQVPYYTALDKGWYKAACLAPKFEAGRGSADTVTLVANGSAPMGVADSVAVIQGENKGLPVQAVGVAWQHDAFAIVSLTKDHIQKPTDLYGKTFGAVVAGSPYIFWKAFIHEQKLDASKIKQVNINPPGYAEMASGKVDFLANFFTAKATLDGMNVPVTLLKGSDFGQKGYGLAILANKDWMKTHGDTITKFLEVTGRAMKYTSQHPTEGVKILGKYNKALNPNAHTLQVNVAQYKETFPLYPNIISGKPYYYIDPA
ncbi:MAG: ABC transporter substrate-binding protein [Chloroflexota bacterium]